MYAIYWINRAQERAACYVTNSTDLFNFLWILERSDSCTVFKVHEPETSKPLCPETFGWGDFKKWKSCLFNN